MEHNQEVAEKPRYWGTSEANRKRVWSDESRAKMSLSLMGNTFAKGIKNPKVAEANKKRIWTDESREKSRISHNPGVPLTVEVRKKMSEAVKKRVAEGRHHNYKGGITPKNRAIRRSIDYRLWREAIFARDNFTCQECEQRGGSLHAHHIKPFAYFPELRFAIDNGLTLCVECHEKTETYKKKIKQK